MELVSRYHILSPSRNHHQVRHKPFLHLCSRDVLERWEIRKSSITKVVARRLNLCGRSFPSTFLHIAHGRPLKLVLNTLTSVTLFMVVQ